MEEQSNYSAAHKGKESKEKKSGQKTFKITITNKSSSAKQFEFNHVQHKKTNVQHAQENKLQEKSRSINQPAVHKGKKSKENNRSKNIQNYKQVNLKTI